ncbi:MAG: hypothetical protein ACI89G_000890 [Minisyncoccia bacterium]|jgi:hypothetical protein
MGVSRLIWTGISLPLSLSPSLSLSLPSKSPTKTLGMRSCDSCEAVETRQGSTQRLRHVNGSYVVRETTATIVQTGVQEVARDVIDWLQTPLATAALALRDLLTGLSNRRGSIRCSAKR